MDKQAASQTLEQIAAFLELKGETPFGVRTYQTAARALAGFTGDIASSVDSGALARVKGVGPGPLEVVRELVATGRSSTLDELREQIPPGLVEMLRIPGLGVAKVRQIHESLGIESLFELEAAALDGRLAKLPRFGAKTAENVRNGITFLRRGSEFRLFHYALHEALGVQRALAELDGVERVELAGSVRRCREVIRDLDLVVVVAGGAAARSALVRQLGQAPGVTEFAGTEGTVTLRFANGNVVDVFLATPEDFGLAWVRATGSAAHLAELEVRARARGVSFGAGGPFPNEASVYRALGLGWIPAELREGMGECDAAASGRLPTLVEQKDLRGLLHCHTNYSDGASTVAEWAETCRAAGYEWIGITDHSQSSPYAVGLAPAAIATQRAEIDAANRTASGFAVLQGVEADILADGTLDYGSETLDRFDFVIGSIHSRFGMSEAEMTRRVLSAMDDPHLAILGHPTGRLLLAREPFAIDLEKVLAKAALRGIAVEVNADPHRLDLDWRTVRQARDMGVTISIGADAHSTGGMTNVAVGLGVARKGWVEARQVLNTRSADAFLEFCRRRRGRA